MSGVVVLGWLFSPLFIWSVGRPSAFFSAFFSPWYSLFYDSFCSSFFLVIPSSSTRRQFFYFYSFFFFHYCLCWLHHSHLPPPFTFIFLPLGLFVGTSLLHKNIHLSFNRHRIPLAPSPSFPSRSWLHSFANMCIGRCRYVIFTSQKDSMWCILSRHCPRHHWKLVHRTHIKWVCCCCWLFSAHSMDECMMCVKNGRGAQRAPL